MRGLLAGIAVVAAFGAGAHRAVVLDRGACAERGQPGAVAFAGWAAWSRYDTISGECSLVVRSPRGVISSPAVPENPGPFAVELGPSAHGVVAVFFECLTARCAIYELRLGHLSAKRLTVPLRASLREPAIWQRTLVFLAVHRLFDWHLGSRTVHALLLPHTRGRNGWPKGGGPISDDRFTRYSLHADAVQRADHNFIRYIDDAIFSVVPYRYGALDDNGEVALVPDLTWTPIPRPALEMICSESEPLC
jgi:hypothetical protein